MAKTKSSKEKKVKRSERVSRPEVEQPEEVAEAVETPETTEDQHEEKEKGQEVVLKPKKESGPSLERIQEVARAAAADPLAANKAKISESRKLLDVTLEPGQKYFETPEGEIIIGDAKLDRIWSRTMNNGAGGYANPRR